MTENVDDEQLHRHCKDCGEAFDLRATEAHWYRHHNLALPVRCKECRELRKYERGTR